MNAGAGWQWAAGLSSLGFYIFLAVWVAASYWSRTREKIAIQETLQKMIQSGTQVTPEVIDALRRTKPARTPAEIATRICKFRYWGIFLIALGALIAGYGLRYADSWVMREMTGSAIVIFVLPGLFFLAYSVIASLASRPLKQ